LPEGLIEDGVIALGALLLRVLKPGKGACMPPKPQLQVPLTFKDGRMLPLQSGLAYQERPIIA
jgi:hypothetical protein